MHTVTKSHFHQITELPKHTTPSTHFSITQSRGHTVIVAQLPGHAATQHTVPQSHIHPITQSQYIITQLNLNHHRFTKRYVFTKKNSTRRCTNFHLLANQSLFSNEWNAVPEWWFLVCYELWVHTDLLLDVGSFVWDFPIFQLLNRSTIREYQVFIFLRSSTLFIHCLFCFVSTSLRVICQTLSTARAQHFPSVFERRDNIRPSLNVRPLAFDQVSPPNNNNSNFFEWVSWRDFFLWIHIAL